MNLRTLTLLLVLALTQGVLSQSDPGEAECVDDKDITIFYVNGVQNSQLDAQWSLRHLRTFYGRHYARENGQDEADKIQYRMAYNHTFGIGFGGAQGDFLEVFLFSDSQDSQVTREMDPGIWKTLREMVNYGQSEGITQLREREIGALTQGLRDLSTHLNFYQKEFTEGRKVVLVAHSEGNFFANFAWEALPGLIQESTKVVSVATPAAVVAGNSGAYTTFRQDQVINTLRNLTVFDEPLNGNIDICAGRESSVFGSIASDSLGHGFTEDYMHCDNSQNRIFGHIDTAIASTTQPPQLARDSIITATLTWGSQPDVDLHIYEPSGFHVFYANPVGPLGGLDVDDTNGGGPEHYFASCQTLQAGTFRFGVNYFTGTGPETATIILQAGQHTRQFEVNLTDSRGSGGDTTPIIFADIVVEGDQEEGFTFSITPTGFIGPAE